MSEDIKKENSLADDPKELAGEADSAVKATEEAVDAAELEATAALDAAAETDGALNEELETLRDTFQAKYDETVGETIAGPVIQELETRSAEVEEDAEETETAGETAAKPVKKKMNKGVKALIIIAVVIAVLVFGLLIAYFVLSVSNPNFNSLVSSLGSASSAQTYEEKKTAYESALSYCEGDSASQNAMRDYIVDEILKAAYSEKGFGEAQKLMGQYLTEEQIAASSSKTVKMIKNVIAAADEIADGSLDAVFEALEENAGADADTVAAKFSVPAETHDVFITAFDDELKAAAELKDGTGIASSTAAIESLRAAYSTFVAAGADKQDLAEKMAVSLYKKGYVFAALSVANALTDPEAEAINQEFTAMREESGDLSDLTVSVYALAEKAVSSKRTDYAALAAENGDISDTKASLIGDLVEFCVEGINAEKDGNYTLAASAFSSTFSVTDALKLTDDKLLFRAANAAVEGGAFQLLQSYDGMLTEEVTKKLPAGDAARVERIHQIYSALNNASNVFSNYYMNYSYSGQPIDYDAACADLDALIKEDSTNYDKGFVAYCKYFAAVYTEHKEDFRKYVDEMKAEMPDLKSVYGYYEIDLAKEDGDYATALSVAEEILAANKGDDYANATVAFVKRTKGDAEGALAAAVKGLDLSGSGSFCSNEAAVDYMLTGNLDSAFPYLKNMYTNAMSIETCDMLLIFNALYKGDDKEIEEELSALVKEIEQTYQNYGVSSLADTTAIINGEKTLEDVFLSGSFALENGEATAAAEAEEAASAEAVTAE